LPKVAEGKLRGLKRAKGAEGRSIEMGKVSFRTAPNIRAPRRVAPLRAARGRRQCNACRVEDTCANITSLVIGKQAAAIASQVWLNQVLSSHCLFVLTAF